MCLILLAWQAHPDYPLVIAANRDEYYQRPTAIAAPWPHQKAILGGRDLSAGGTWLAVTASGRFAAVTNVREPGAPPGKRSRGELTRQFLEGRQSAMDYLQGLQGDDYGGFNLVVGDGRTVAYCSNRGQPPQALAAGCYGLSNRHLDTPWPKLVTAKAAFTEALPQLPATAGLFQLLTNDDIVPDHQLPDTGVTLEWERRLSAIFVRSPHYGTRASTVITRNRAGQIRLTERSFGPEGSSQGEVNLSLP